MKLYNSSDDVAILLKDKIICINFDNFKPMNYV